MNSLRQQVEMQTVIAQLRARDQEVRAHEMAHLAAAGGYATSGASYTYQTGPDGRKYAVGGEVGIDLSPEQNPRDTIRKMQVVQQAALAPAEPSAQDMHVAAAAAQAIVQAQQQLAQQARDSKSNPVMEGKSEKSSISLPQANNSESTLNRRKKLAESEGALVLAGKQARLVWQTRLAVQQASN
jgi:hypothetical protein